MLSTKDRSNLFKTWCLLSEYSSSVFDFNNIKGKRNNSDILKAKRLKRKVKNKKR